MLRLLRGRFDQATDYGQDPRLARKWAQAGADGFI
jgi:hypothetical protein